MARQAAGVRRALGEWHGEWALQVGGNGYCWCPTGCYRRLVTLGRAQPGKSFEARAAALPLGEATLDLVLLIYRLGTRADAAAILAEAARVLRGEGRLVIVDQRFPVSLREWRSALRGPNTGCLRAHRLVRSVGLEWCGGTGFFAGGRRPRACLSLGINAYAASAVKRVAGTRLLRPRWKTQRSRRRPALQEHGHAG